MKLFFETSSQASYFLAAVPLGFATAFCLDFGKNGGIGRFLLDLILLLLSGVSLLVLVFLMRDTRIRLYHVLGMISGAFIYLRGMGAIKCRLAEKYHLWKMKRCKQENRPTEANTK